MLGEPRAARRSAYAALARSCSAPRRPRRRLGHPRRRCLEAKRMMDTAPCPHVADLQRRWNGRRAMAAPAALRGRHAVAAASASAAPASSPGAASSRRRRLGLLLGRGWRCVGHCDRPRCGAEARESRRRRPPRQLVRERRRPRRYHEYHRKQTTQHLFIGCTGSTFPVKEIPQSDTQTDTNTLCTAVDHT